MVIYIFLMITEIEKKCDDLEGWCAEINPKVDCCGEFIQRKCPGQCKTCPGYLDMQIFIIDINHILNHLRNNPLY